MVAKLIFGLTLSLSFCGLLLTKEILGQTNDHEEIFFTAAGFDRPGVPKEADVNSSATLRIEVRDQQSGLLTPCRINVVGPDGNYYQPANRFESQFDMTGVWPKNGAWGNRPGKAPYRYLGHFFYSKGFEELNVPVGKIRVEVWKGFEYRPTRIELEVVANQANEAKLSMIRTTPMLADGYFGGDPHLHFPRTNDRQQDSIFQLLEAEDVWYGASLGYNEPAGPYSGLMETMASPQSGLGLDSILTRGNYSLLSGQEYRSAHFGHLNLYLLSKLVFEGEKMHLDDGPAFGIVGSQAIASGGYAIQAHGGYSKEIFADVALGSINAVELLQFGIYRELGLSGWYDMLNTGYRFPCVGASDFPACRFMSDCRTYVKPKRFMGLFDKELRPGFAEWMEAMADGRSFVTTGPMLLLTVDDAEPGAVLHQSQTNSSHRIRVRVCSEVANVSHVDLIVSGKVVKRFDVPIDKQRSVWFEADHSLDVGESCWIAARAWSEYQPGLPDAEAHTNPVYIDFNGKRTYHQASLDRWVEKIDGQIAFHAKRKFIQKANVLAYFQKARDTLLRVRSRSGISSNQLPWELTQTDTGKKAASFESFANREWNEDELREFLTPVPPLSPEKALQSIEVAEGFRVDLVAAEPLVCDPVAATWDERGQLYVCEMRDYPFKPKEGGTPLGTIRLLRDRDGDGNLDDAHLFADKLLWPAGIVPWKGGVFVAAPPDIWYLKDTDNDDRADIKRRIFTGFGTENQQAMVNNLQFGLDQWVYGTTAGNGGTITSVDMPNLPPLVLNGRDFRFDPVTERIEAVTGTVQFGNTFDDWGNRFTCSESQPLLHIVQPDHYLARNPFLIAPRGIFNTAPGPVPIYRISPVERWRQVRSSRRIAKSERSAESPGASHHVIDAAAGVTIYRGDVFPPEFQGQAFVGDGQNNLVHRRKLQPSGVTFQSQRVDEKTEFLRSSDIWFRPVNFMNAPDGTLYCLDMYREVLESIHVPLDVARHLNFANGRDRGRIYRIAPKNFLVPRPPDLVNADTPQLVEYLRSSNAWWRDTAQRLLIERNAIDATTSIRKLVRLQGQEKTKIHALWILNRLGQLDRETIALALRDDHPRVRELALRLSEPFLKSMDQNVFKLVTGLVDDDDVRVRYQLSFSIGESKDPSVPTILSRLASNSGSDPWFATAILSSSQHHALGLFQGALKDTKNSNASMIPPLLQLLGGRNQKEELLDVLEALKFRASLRTSSNSVDPYLFELANGLRRIGQSFPEEFLNDPWFKNQIKLANVAALDSAKGETDRIAVIGLLGMANGMDNVRTLASLISPDVSERLQIAALRSLSQQKSYPLPTEVATKWRSMTPDIRRVAAELILMTLERTEKFLKIASSEKIALHELDPLSRDQLLQHHHMPIRDQAERIFSKHTLTSRQEVIDRYQSALTKVGDIDSGKRVFEKNCSACHQVSGLGSPVGPNLASSTLSDPRTVLIHILDPNRYILPNYVQYAVLDQQGQIFSGQIASQSANSVTLRKDRDNTLTILRSDIVELKSTGKSMMPEELERAITVDAMGDLLAFLQASATKGTLETAAVRDFGTLPGLIEP